MTARDALRRVLPQVHARRLDCLVQSQRFRPARTAIPRLIQCIIHSPNELLHLREHQAGGTIVAQRFSGVENSLVGTLKFFQENRCALSTRRGVSRHFVRDLTMQWTALDSRVLNNAHGLVHIQQYLS